MVWLHQKAWTNQDQNEILLYEVWDSQEAHQKYVNWRVEIGDIPKLVFATGDYAFISFSMCACLLSLPFILNCLLVSKPLNCD